VAYGLQVISAHHVSPDIDWEKDVLYIPVDIEPDFVIGFLEDNVKKLRVRHASSSSTTEHVAQVQEVSKSLAKLLGAKSIVIGNRLAKSRFLQFAGLLNLKRNFPQLRSLDLSQWTIVVDTMWKVDMKKHRLFVTYDFEMTEFTTVITKKLRECRE
jgi:hypothetical protein